MTDKVEQVARALAKNFKDANSAPTNLAWKDFQREARVSIEAMRDPTKEMQHAGLLALDKSDTCNCDQHDVWSAMVDAALIRSNRSGEN